MGAKTGDRVSINYTCTLDDGTIFATTKHLDPLEFIIGESEVMAGLEETVVGMNPGDSKSQRVPSEKAYGPYRREMIETLERDMMPGDLTVETGTSLRVRYSDGRESEVLVTASTGSTITVDGNHPLAGKNLTFEIELLDLEAPE